MHSQQDTIGSGMGKAVRHSQVKVKKVAERDSGTILDLCHVSTIPGRPDLLLANATMESLARRVSRTAWLN